MIRYKDNSSLELKTVTTVNGEKEYRRNCRCIKEKYYVINIDAFEIDGTWYRKESGNIIYDNFTKEWVVKGGEKAKKLKHGIVGVSASGEIKFDYFSTDPYNTVNVVRLNKGDYPAMSIETLDPKIFIEDVGNGVWYERAAVGSTTISNCKKIRNERGYTDKGYNIEDNVDEFRTKVQLFKDYKPKMSKACLSLAKMLGDITIGAEIEVCTGFLPDHLQNRCGIVPCRDGSIGGGPEFVTVPMTAAKALWNLKTLAEECPKRTNVDINCSLHYHFGNLSSDRLYLASVYYLGLAIQDELFQMFPYYKTEPRGVKKKNYNKKLDRMNLHYLQNSSEAGYNSFVDYFYEKLFYSLTEGAHERTPGYKYNKQRREHPIRQKWQRDGRYRWINFTNMIFSHRETIEFRPHPGTTNFYKMVNWLLICNAILKYAEQHSKDIITGEKVTVKDVLNYYGDNFGTSGKKVSKYLIAYFESQKSIFSKDYAAGDVISTHDMTRDKSFKFTTDDVEKLF